MLEVPSKHAGLEVIAVAALPILVVVLTLSGVAKLAMLASRRQDASGVSPGSLSRLGPAALVPERFATTMTVLCATAEFGFAAGLVLVDHPVARWPSVAFFAVATYVLLDLRRRRPDVGCGCFGEVSSAPVGLRSIGRTVIFTAMAIAVAVENVTWAGTMHAFSPASSPSAVFWLGGLVVLLLALSPEIDAAVARLRHRLPCEQRPQPAARALARLKSSTAWRAYVGMLEADEPTDTWRELCWRFFVFPAGDGTDVVFAVQLSGRRPAVRSAVVSDGEPPLPSLRESMPVSA